MGTYACFVIGREGGWRGGFWLCKPLYNVFVIVQEKGDFEQIADCFEYVQREIFGSAQDYLLCCLHLYVSILIQRHI